jgi:hypothetical protein
MYSGHVAIAITQAASRASMKPERSTAVQRASRLGRVPERA